MCPDDWNWFFSILERWQTLLAGVLALIGAAAGAYFLHRQIRQNWSIEDKRRVRKRAALRATGPLALASISEYAIACVPPLKDLHQQCKGQRLAASTIRVPSIPSVPTESITFLSDFIEYSEPGETDLIEQLLREIQVQSGRLKTMLLNIGSPNWMVTKSNIEEYLIDTAGIYARAAASFNFFRGKSDKLPTQVNWEDVKAALRNLDVHESNYSDVYDRIDRAAQTSDGPTR